MGNGFGLTSLIFGSISIPVCVAMGLMGFLGSLWAGLLGIPNFTSFISIIGWVIPSIAIVFGIIGAIRDDSKGKAVAGLVLGAIALIVGIMIIFMFASLFAPFLP